MSQKKKRKKEKNPLETQIPVENLAGSKEPIHQPQGQLYIYSLFTACQVFHPILAGMELFKQYLYYILKIILSLEKKHNSISIAKPQRVAGWRSNGLGFNLILICSKAKVIFL